MDWSSLLGPAVVAAIVSCAVTIVGFIVSNRTARRLHTERLHADRGLAERKITADIDLAERKLRADIEIAEKKLVLERELASWQRMATLAEEALADCYKIREIIQDARILARMTWEHSNPVKNIPTKQRKKHAFELHALKLTETSRPTTTSMLHLDPSYTALRRILIMRQLGPTII
jgi:hypothetical protein